MPQVVPFGSSIDHNAAAKDTQATKHPPGENATGLRIYSSCSNRLPVSWNIPSWRVSNNMAGKSTFDTDPIMKLAF